MHDVMVLERWYVLVFDEDPDGVLIYFARARFRHELAESVYWVQHAHELEMSAL